MFSEVMRGDIYRAYRERLVRLLQIPLGATDQNIHHLIEAGFVVDRIKVLCQPGTSSPLQLDQIIPLATLEPGLSYDQKLTIYESNHLFRVVHITIMAEVIFGSEIKSRRWLSKSKVSLSGKSPISMLSTLEGTREVENMLIKIAEAYAL
jgi:putative toxin-antitoxin system antitoxin component (TIGR02293 family)